jgi:hypothetical protein
MNQEDFGEELDKYFRQYNQAPLDDFNGLSPNQMDVLIYDVDLAIEFNLEQEELLTEIPLFNLVNYLMLILQEKGKIKLTKKGNLPLSVVKDIYAQKYKPEWAIEKGYSKLASEDDSRSVQLAHLMLTLSHCIKKRHNSLSLTKKGIQLLKDQKKLAREVLIIFTYKFNWGYFDGYRPEDIAQFGMGYLLYLYRKFYRTHLETSWYGEQYALAFPAIYDAFEGGFLGPSQQSFNSCISTRFFHLFLSYLGVAIVRMESVETPETVEALPLLDKLITLHIH